MFVTGMESLAFVNGLVTEVELDNNGSTGLFPSETKLLAMGKYCLRMQQRWFYDNQFQGSVCLPSWG
jgi:hypothetical protein